MASVPAPVQATLSGRSFLSATLDSVHRCPARSDYIDLRFSTSAGFWQWCFPEPPGRRRVDQRGVVPLALTFGRYGAQAHVIRDDELGPALPSSAALPLILGDAYILVERRLITTDTGAATA
ncbi:hypothetical protein ACIBG0_01310 [Nocardia sp. NPDC050630]|uniref:hypothetical protein n=1 Tax=Nocardia sp. NPDC050630 TaxID=3364321 RepID=UPI003799DC6E